MLGRYAKYLKNKKNASNNTAISYLRDVKKFGTYIEEINVSYEKVDEKTISQYIETLKTAKMARSSVLRMIASLRSFYGFLYSTGEVLENPLEKIKSPKAQKPEFEVINSNEINNLLLQPVCTGFKGYRDKAMLELMYATGIKVSELIDLKILDVNIEDKYIVCGRGDKKRSVPMGTVATSALKTYMKKARFTVSGNDELLFVNINGGKMSRQGFWKIIKYYKEKAEITADVNANSIRHSFAVHLMENGADTRSVQDMLGNASAASMKIYEEKLNNLSSVYAKAHPRA